MMSGDLKEKDFWSRRRAAVQREETETQKAEAARDRRDAQAGLEEKSDAEILEALDLPDPDKMTAGDDFSAFMSEAVPDRLRRRALRVLWRANPVLANLDELLEYGEDYTDAAVVVENLQTAYQVGRGMLRHVEEMARQAEEAGDDSADTETADVETVEADAEAPVERQSVQTSDAISENLEDVHASADEPTDVAALPTPRRMKFKSEEPA